MTNGRENQGELDSDKNTSRDKRDKRVETAAKRKSVAVAILTDEEAPFVKYRWGPVDDFELEGEKSHRATITKGLCADHTLEVWTKYSQWTEHSIDPSVQPDTASDLKLNFDLLLPSKDTSTFPKGYADLADTFLLFACKSPHDAEAAVGDLMQRCGEVLARRCRTVAAAYFVWELSLMIISKARKRFVDATIRALLDKWLKGSAS